MKPALRRMLKACAPLFLRRGVQAWRGRRLFQGDFPTWAEARRGAAGYDDERIVAKVLASTLAVRSGRAAFERDGVTFAEPEDEPGLRAALHLAALNRGGRLRVLDFGGALGSTYWRHREWLKRFSEVMWDVVEQPRFVAAGREHFSETPIRFFSSVASAEAVGPHDVLLASGTLQYLDDPYAALKEWQTKKFPFLLFNNVPLHREAPDRIAVQQVPPEIYPASYPVWFFNRDRFLGQLLGEYQVASEFASEAIWPVGWRRYASTGLLLARRTNT